MADAEPASELAALIHAHVMAELDDRNMHAVMLSELHSLSPERRACVVDLRDDYERLVYETIVKGQATRHLRSDLSPRLLTLALLDMLNWAVFWFRPGGGSTESALGLAMADVFLNGASQASVTGQSVQEG